jgi:very-short-patch-repair endonuclease/ribosomal protein L32
MIVKKGSEIGKIDRYYYAFAPCEICGVERWVIFKGGKLATHYCKKCGTKVGAIKLRGRKQSQATIDKRRITQAKNHPLKLIPCSNCGKLKHHIPSRVKEYNFCSQHCCATYFYAHGIKDPHKITQNAHKAMHKLLDKGEWSLQKPENIKKGHQSCGSKNYGKTWLEERTGWALNKLGLKFESQYPIEYGLDILNRKRYYFPDFAFPNNMLLVECDGSYWHKGNRDKIRQVRLNELGWQVVRFTDKEINKDLLGCANKVKSILPVIP